MAPRIFGISRRDLLGGVIGATHLSGMRSDSGWSYGSGPAPRRQGLRPLVWQARLFGQFGLS